LNVGIFFSAPQNNISPKLIHTAMAKAKQIHVKENVSDLKRSINPFFIINPPSAYEKKA